MKKKNLIAKELDRTIYTLSAINSGVKDVREVIRKASSLGLFGKKKQDENFHRQKAIVLISYLFQNRHPYRTQPILKILF